MSRTLLSLAGFQVITNGRFWVIADVPVTVCAERDQIRFHVVSASTSKLQVMDFQSLHRAARLASHRTKSIVKSPKLYLADTGLLCALLNIRSEEALRQAPGADAIWETFVFAQLRARERRAGRMGSLFFWRDRTREVDFVVDIGGRMELFEAKWTEVPAASDAVNLDFVRSVVGKSRIVSSAIVCRTSNSFPTADGVRAVPATELG